MEDRELMDRLRIADCMSGRGRGDHGLSSGSVPYCMGFDKASEEYIIRQL